MLLVEKGNLSLLFQATEMLPHCKVMHGNLVTWQGIVCPET